MWCCTRPGCWTMTSKDLPLGPEKPMVQIPTSTSTSSISSSSSSRSSSRSSQSSSSSWRRHGTGALAFPQETRSSRLVNFLGRDMTPCADHRTDRQVRQPWYPAKNWKMGDLSDEVASKRQSLLEEGNTCFWTSHVCFVVSTKVEPHESVGIITTTVVRKCSIYV